MRGGILNAMNGMSVREMPISRNVLSERPISCRSAARSRLARNNLLARPLAVAL